MTYTPSMATVSISSMALTKDTNSMSGGTSDGRSASCELTSGLYAGPTQANALSFESAMFAKVDGSCLMFTSSVRTVGRSQKFGNFLLNLTIIFGQDRGLGPAVSHPYLDIAHGHCLWLPSRSPIPEQPAFVPRFCPEMRTARSPGPPRRVVVDPQPTTPPSSASTKKKRKKKPNRPPWDDSVTNLDEHRLTKQEQERRRLAHLQSDVSDARRILRQREAVRAAKARALRAASGSPARMNVTPTKHALAREDLDSLEDLLADSSGLADELLGTDQPEKRVAVPVRTMAPPLDADVLDGDADNTPRLMNDPDARGVAWTRQYQNGHAADGEASPRLSYKQPDTDLHSRRDSHGVGQDTSSDELERSSNDEGKNDDHRNTRSTHCHRRQPLPRVTIKDTPEYRRFVRNEAILRQSEATTSSTQPQTGGRDTASVHHSPTTTTQSERYDQQHKQGRRHQQHDKHQQHGGSPHHEEYPDLRHHEQQQQHHHQHEGQQQQQQHDSFQQQQPVDAESEQLGVLNQVVAQLEDKVASLDARRASSIRQAQDQRPHSFSSYAQAIITAVSQLTDFVSEQDAVVRAQAALSEELVSRVATMERREQTHREQFAALRAQVETGTKLQQQQLDDLAAARAPQPNQPTLSSSRAPSSADDVRAKIAAADQLLQSLRSSTASATGTVPRTSPISAALASASEATGLSAEQLLTPHRHGQQHHARRPQHPTALYDHRGFNQADAAAWSSQASLQPPLASANRFGGRGQTQHSTAEPDSLAHLARALQALTSARSGQSLTTQ
eukprot:m.306064 g.306064  ORF g.306064 m.306064 type:complete len:787 (+) comp19618_c0_seq6:932-3292(+)